MNSKWTSHLSKDLVKRTEFFAAVKAATPVLNRLKDVLTKDLEVSCREQRKIDHYNTPNWELRQVDCNATQRTLDRVIKLLEI